MGRRLLETTHLWLFFVVVFGVIVLPGLDMAFALASSLVGGRSSGFAAIAGIVTGGVVHMTMGTLGVVAVLRTFPAAFNALLLAGALYVAWIGIGLLGTRGAFAEPAPTRARSRGARFRQGMATSLLNPKAYLFTLAVYGGLVVAGDRARAWFADRPTINRGLSRGVGVLLLATAVLTAYQGWQSGGALT